MGKGILVIGSLNMDLSVSMDAMPVVGETILGNGLAYQAGGKGANQACAAGRLGGQVKILGCVGQDAFGNRQIESLKASGVDTSYIKVSQDQPTGTAVIYVDRQGNNSIVVVPGANRECSAEYLSTRRELFEWCSCIVLQMEIPEAAVLYAARLGRKLGKTVILNPAPAPDRIPDELLGLVDYLTPNETELAKLSKSQGEDLESVRAGAKELIRRGVKQVIVTMGSQGALLVNRDSENMYPARRVKAVDTTAAGDCFNGAFAAALAEGMTEGEAVCFANAAASIAVTREGAQSSIPTRAEVEGCFRQRAECI